MYDHLHKALEATHARHERCQQVRAGTMCGPHWHEAGLRFSYWSVTRCVYGWLLCQWDKFVLGTRHVSRYTKDASQQVGLLCLVPYGRNRRISPARNMGPTMGKRVVMPFLGLLASPWVSTGLAWGDHHDDSSSSGSGVVDQGLTPLHQPSSRQHLQPEFSACASPQALPLGSEVWLRVDM